MRGLKARYRHVVFCGHHMCEEVIAHMGDVSAAVQDTGAPINALDFDFGGTYVFEVMCKGGHVTRLAAPRDVQLVRGIAAMQGDEGPELVLKRR